MYKAILKYNNSILKSYDIYDLWKFIVSNPFQEYELYVGYNQLKTDDFIIIFLHKSNSYRDYIRLRESFYKTPTIREYAKTRRVIS